MAKQLTEMQQKFLDVLFEEAKGDAAVAKRLAGYSDHVATITVVRPLQEEIEELTRKFLLRSATKAAYALSEVMAKPADFGNKEKMNAAKDILDRSGFIKTEKVEVKTTSPLFILPPKSDDSDS